MPIPYTRAALAVLREASRANVPLNALVARLGWSPSFLERVCRSHGIIPPPPPVEKSLTHVTVAPLPPAEQLARFMAGLPPRQLNAMRIMCAARVISDGYIPATAISGSEVGNSSTRAVGRVMGGLIAKMSDARLPYRIERKVNEGYRLLGAKS